MRRPSAISAIALLALAPAPPAWAIIACQACSSCPGYERCIGYCSGHPVPWCDGWYLYGCGGSLRALSPGETLSGADSLRALSLRVPRAAAEQDRAGPGSAAGDRAGPLLGQGGATIDPIG